MCPTDVAPESPESYYRVSDRLAAEIPGAFKPNQYFNMANPRGALRARPGPRSGSRPAGGSRTWSRASARAARSAASARYLKERNPDIADHRRRPRRLDLLGRERRRGQGLPRRGRGRGLLARDVRHVDRRPLGAGLRQGLVPDHAPPGDGGGHPGRRLVRHRDARGARGRGGRSTTPRRWSSSCSPTAGARTCRKIFNDAWMTPVRLPRARGRPRRRRRPAPQARRRRRSRRWSPSRPTRRSATRWRCCTSTASRSCRSSAPTTRHASSARSASAACWRRAADEPALLGAEIVDVMEPPLHARRRPTTRSARPSSCWPATARRCSSWTTAAPVGHRHARRPARALAREPERAFATRAVHAGLDAGPDLRVGHPGHPPDLHVRAASAVGEFVEDYDYARSANPTRTALETALGELEGGLGRRSPPGMAASTRSSRAVCSAGDHVVLPADLYGGTYRLVDKVLARFGHLLHLVDQTDLDAVEARGPATPRRLVWVETPTNPHAQRHRRRGRSIARGARRASSPSTTRSPRRSTSARWSSAPTSSCTRRPSTSAGTPTPSAAPWSSRDPRGPRACALRAERRRRGPRAVRLLPRAPRAAHAAPAHGRPRGERRGGRGVPARRAGRRGRPLAGLQRHGQLPPPRRAWASRSARELFTLAESLGGVESLVEVPQAMTHQSVEGSAAAVPADLVRLSCGVEDAARTWSTTCAPRWAEPSAEAARAAEARVILVTGGKRTDHAPPLRPWPCRARRRFGAAADRPVPRLVRHRPERLAGVRGARPRARRPGHRGDRRRAAPGPHPALERVGRAARGDGDRRAADHRPAAGRRPRRLGGLGRLARPGRQPADGRRRVDVADEHLGHRPGRRP